MVGRDDSALSDSPREPPRCCKTRAAQRWGRAQSHGLTTFPSRTPSVIVLSAWRGASAAECGALSGLLLFSALPMTSYDYTWLVMLVALAKSRPKILPALLAFALFTHLLFVMGGEEMEAPHLVASLVCAVLLAAAVPGRALWDDIVRRVAPITE